MAGGGSALIAILVVLGMLHNAAAKTYQVGGPSANGVSSWTYLSPDSTSYDDLFKNVTLVVGDELSFQFTEGAHDVYEVPPANVASCSFASPIQMYNQSVTVTLGKAGDYGFLCHFPNHCKSGGMHLSVTVHESAGRWPTPAPRPPPHHSPTPAPGRSPHRPPKRSPVPSPHRPPKRSPGASPHHSPTPAPGSPHIHSPTPAPGSPHHSPTPAPGSPHHSPTPAPGRSPHHSPAPGPSPHHSPAPGAHAPGPAIPPAHSVASVLRSGPAVILGSLLAAFALLSV